MNRKLLVSSIAAATTLAAFPALAQTTAGAQAIEEIEQRTAALTWSAQQVAVVIERALTDNNPRPRYIAATGGKTMLFIMTSSERRTVLNSSD